MYLAWPVPDCEPGCPSNWIKDGFCDKTCNTSTCLWDGGDCTVRQQSFRSDHSSNILKQNHLSNRFPGAIAHNQEPLCSASCANSWLGDRFCDKVCNNKECAFDLGDCGMEHFSPALIGIDVEEHQSTYCVAHNSIAIYMNLTRLLDEPNKGSANVEDASYEANTLVRAAALNTKLKLLTILFVRSNSSANTNVSIEIRYKGRGHSPNIDRLQLVLGDCDKFDLKSALPVSLNRSNPNSNEQLNMSTTVRASPYDLNDTDTQVTFETFAVADLMPKILVTSGAFNNAFNLSINSSLIGSAHFYGVESNSSVPAGYSDRKISSYSRSSSVGSTSNPQTTLTEQYRPFRWEKRGLLADSLQVTDERIAAGKRRMQEAYKSRKLLDVYGDRYVCTAMCIPRWST